MLAEETLLRRRHPNGTGLFSLTADSSVPTAKHKSNVSGFGLLLITSSFPAPADQTPQVLHSNGPVESFLPSETSQVRYPSSEMTFLAEVPKTSTIHPKTWLGLSQKYPHYPGTYLS